jgi:hypothetical protein
LYNCFVLSVLAPFETLSPSISYLFLIDVPFQELWEENLSAAVTLQILEIVEKFMEAAAVHVVGTDYVKLDCITTIFVGFLSRSQPLSFWKAFLPVFNTLFRSHGSILMTRENDRFLKQVVFHLLRLAVFRNETIRKMAVVGLQILVRVSDRSLAFYLGLQFIYVKS